MTSIKQASNASLTALAPVTTLAISSIEARTRFHAWGIAALAVGGLLAGRAYAEQAYDNDAPVRRCDMVEPVNRCGEVVGYRKVCSLY